eukprot:CAMPEP_0203859510 /NCGR_PEP_ID=MMETSP0359-20131031/11890_1 /ASSEMBLY_ACC=CAM_ASM_000338 /TAXON_ID=268821 /ORGANISM="Scrippsiella Hangoei, Strain SHTV-5" /LENGTH=226 /DNA_ID=CAMNT_0050776441 /DNA_START=47 /DNA_END=723 /DNA_ORIENTATION=+
MESSPLHGHAHDPWSSSQNVGNMLGSRPCVRQTPLYRKHESGNSMKNILGMGHLAWSPPEEPSSASSAPAPRPSPRSRQPSAAVAAPSACGPPRPASAQLDGRTYVAAEGAWTLHASGEDTWAHHRAADVAGMAQGFDARPEPLAQTWGSGAPAPEQWRRSGGSGGSAAADPLRRCPPDDMEPLLDSRAARREERCGFTPPARVNPGRVAVQTPPPTSAPRPRRLV